MKTLMNKALLITILLSYATTDCAVKAPVKKDTHVVDAVKEFLKNAGKKSAEALWRHKKITIGGSIIGASILFSLYQYLSYRRHCQRTWESLLEAERLEAAARAARDKEAAKAAHQSGKRPAKLNPSLVEPVVKVLQNGRPK